MYSWIQTVRCTMALLKLWIVFVYLTTSTVSTVNPVNYNDREIVDIIVGEQCIIVTWPLNGSNLAVNVTKGKGARLTGFIDGSIGKHATVQFGRLILKYNHSIMSASLMLATVSREDDGIYEIEESVYTTMPVPYDNCTYACKTKYGIWILELNVLETSDVTQGETGKSMAMEFEVVSGVSTLFNYVTVSELMGEKGCSISTQSHLYGRLKCTRDTLRNIYRITIDNVTQRDSGLYKVSTESEKSMRRFLNITEKPTCAVVGDNMTIGWFYNQQGIQRTLMVIHPNQEVIMQLAPSNVPEIKSKFKHRLSYKGDVSRNFMMLSLLNVTMSDAGVYTLETLHGNTIPGSKQLNVEAVCTTTSSTMTNLPLSVPLHPYSVRRTFEPATELLSTRQEPMNTRYIAIVSGSVSVIILMIIAFIYLQRRNNFRLDAAISTLLPVSQWNEERSEQSDAQSGLTCNEILGLHYAAIKDLTTVYTEGSNNYSLSEIEDQNNLSDNSNGISSAACDYDAEERILGEPPSVSALQTTISDDDNEINGVVSGEVAENIQDLYAKVNKRPISSSSNTEKRNPRHEHANETEENNGHETFKTVLNLMSTKDANVYADADEAAIEIKNMEPTEDMILPVTSCEDYSDTLL